MLKAVKNLAVSIFLCTFAQELETKTKSYGIFQRRQF